MIYGFFIFVQLVMHLLVAIKKLTMIYGFSIFVQLVMHLPFNAQYYIDC